MGDSIVEVNIKSGVAGALFQGDIVLTKEQQGEIAAEISGDRSKRQAFNAEGWPAKLWSDGVPYMFSILNNKAKNAFKKAADLWMQNTCINFTEYEMPKGRVSKPMPKYFLVVIAGDGCHSEVGKVANGIMQELSLGDRCETVRVK
ncbi:astacin, partial [Ostertagia ostertagi]